MSTEIFKNLGQPWYIVTPLRLAFGRFNVLFWCHGMTLPLVCWAFDVGAWPERRSLVKLALPGLQKAQCFHRNTIDFGQLDRGRRRGVTMYQGHAANGIIPMGQWAENPKRGVLGVPNLQFHRSMESGAGAHALQDLSAHRSRPVNAKRRGVRNASSALARKQSLPLWKNMVAQPRHGESRTPDWTAGRSSSSSLSEWNLTLPVEVSK